LRIDKIIPLLILLGLLQACFVPVNPQPSQEEKASKVNVQLGIGYMQQNNLQLASEKLTKAIRTEKAEFHYKKATKLDPENSQAANNYGAFLCRQERQLEAEKYFMRALENPLYSTPEFAYTNAAICLLQLGDAEETEQAKEYLHKAIAAKSDFASALLALANLLFDEGDYAAAKPYLDHLYLVARPTARSLWLTIRNTLQLDGDGNVAELAQRLATDFPDSNEYKEWLAIQ